MGIYITFAAVMIICVKEYENGGKIDVYTLVDTSASDYKKVFACCEYFAAQGAQVIIYPRFGETVGNRMYEKIFASLENTPFWGKCPDFTVNDAWYEHEGFDVSKDLSAQKKQLSTFCNMLGRGVKQSDRIIVEDCFVSRFSARRAIYQRIHHEHQNISEVYIRTGVGLELLYKKGEG